MKRLPSTALIFGTALSLSLPACTTVPSASSERSSDRDRDDDDDDETNAQVAEVEQSESLADEDLTETAVAKKKGRKGGKAKRALAGKGAGADIEALDTGSDDEEITLSTLKNDLDAIQKQLQQLDSKINAIKAGGGGTAAASPEDESKATEIRTQLMQHITDGEMGKAKELMAELGKSYRGTSAYKSLQRRTAPELAVIGKKVPQSIISPHIDSWFVDGQTNLDSGVTLVVFWEIWCPHCKREMPELVELYNQRKGQGLKILGLTRLTKSATAEKVEAFVGELKLNYPIAKENGKIAPIFNVSGIPAAAVVKDGEIIWRGHPNGITDALWDKWLN